MIFLFSKLHMLRASIKSTLGLWAPLSPEQIEKGVPTQHSKQLQDVVCCRTVLSCGEPSRHNDQLPGAMETIMRDKDVAGTCNWAFDFW